MSRFLLVALLVAAVGIGSWVGCGPRVEVAKDKIIAKLDKALGDLNVKRKKIELKQTELHDKLDVLRKSRYTTEAKLDLLASKKEKSQKALDSIRDKVGKVSELVGNVKDSSDGEIERNGKKHSAEDIQKLAEEVAAMYKAEQVKLASLETSYKALSKSVGFLKTQEETSTKLMRELEQKISEIDANKIAVDAVKESTSIAGDNKSISEELELMAKDIEDLGVEVEAALNMESDRMRDQMSDLDSNTSAVDEILSEPTDLNATQDMLDSILAGEDK
jgi:phage shock protein A